jgi:N-acetylglucosamine-6-phosphate deacetylase
MLTVFFNGRLLTDSGFVDDQALLVRDGRIENLVAAADPRVAAADRRIDLGGDMLAPGFIDTQVNGGGGVLFNQQPDVEAIRAIGAAHRRYGTTGFLPTLITDDLDTVGLAMQAADRAVREVPGCLGIHVEGPFLNQQRKGIHDASKFRRLDERAFQLLTSLSGGRTLVTLAPELTTPEMVARLAGAGLIVSAGHTDGSYQEISAAIEAGLTGFTHLFNAMSPLASRQPGAVGAALDHDGPWLGIIVDGHHVAPASLRIALKAKGADKLMLVTDAMPSVGAADKSFLLQGRSITVVDGVCVDEKGVMAGADLDMAGAVRNAVALLGVDLPTAIRMASHVPASFLGLGGELGRLAPGYRADLVRLTDKVEVAQSWISGEPDQARRAPWPKKETASP